MTLRVVLYRQKQHQTSRVTASEILSTATISSGAKQTSQQQLHITLVIADKYWCFCSDSDHAVTVPMPPKIRAQSCWPSCLGLVRKRKTAAGLPQGSQHWWKNWLSSRFSKPEAHWREFQLALQTVQLQKGKLVLEYRYFHTSQFAIVQFPLKHEGSVSCSLLCLFLKGVSCGCPFSSYTEVPCKMKIMCTLSACSIASQRLWNVQC